MAPQKPDVLSLSSSRHSQSWDETSCPSRDTSALVIFPSLPHGSLQLRIICSPDLQLIQQDERVSMGTDGNLYFSHALQNDSRQDYYCNAAFPKFRTIVQKIAMAVTVRSCMFTQHRAWFLPKNITGREAVTPCLLINQQRPKPEQPDCFF